MQRCKNCIYHSAAMECRRHAPIAADTSWHHPELGQQAETRAIWPPTNTNDWCGDWKKDPDFT